MACGDFDRWVIEATGTTQTVLQKIIDFLLRQGEAVLRLIHPHT